MGVQEAAACEWGAAQFGQSTLPHPLLPVCFPHRGFLSSRGLSLLPSARPCALAISPVPCALVVSPELGAQTRAGGDGRWDLGSQQGRFPGSAEGLQRADTAGLAAVARLASDCALP